MSESEVNRLRWTIIQIVNDYFQQNFGSEAESLGRQFEEGFGSKLLKSLEGEQTDIHHLIREFKPALGSILEPGEHFDRIMSSVSSLFNAALSRTEQENLRLRLEEQEDTKRTFAPKTHAIQLYNGLEQMKLLSVGIDVGSSTTHLIFSRLMLGRERSFLNPTNRFKVVDREILYESDIIFTPLLDNLTIDVDAVVKFCQDQYHMAGFSPEMVDTGAVIVTGEAAKKQNAEEIVKRLSSESGKFVSAVAGPNFESILGAMGSGIVELSGRTGRTILHADVGGGTSNLAICSKGAVHSTSCINVGGRLLGFDKDFRIWRIDGPTKLVMKELGMNYEIGDIIGKHDVKLIAHTYAEALIEVLLGPAESLIARELMMTGNLDFSIPVDEYSFSGGIAELLYGENAFFDDIGFFLVEELRPLFEERSLTLVEPSAKIRATVIGAGAFTLSISGSTCFFDRSIQFPITNIPVIPINVTTQNYRLGKVEEEINRSLKMFDLNEGTDIVGLYFKDSLYRSYSWLQEFVKEIERSLPKTIGDGRMVVLLFESDIGRMVGLMAQRETSINHNLISLDELSLEEGDWIDIGAPLQDGQIFPVTVKSLVFNLDREHS